MNMAKKKLKRQPQFTNLLVRFTGDEIRDDIAKFPIEYHDGREGEFKHLK